MNFPLFLPLWVTYKGNLCLLPCNLIQKSCGISLCFPRCVSVNIHCGTNIGMSQQLDYPVSLNNMDLQRCRISTQHFIPHRTPLTNIKKIVPGGIRPTERKPLQEPKPCTKRYNGIKKRLIGRMPVNLFETEIKGRDKSPLKPFSIHLAV